MQTRDIDYRDPTANLRGYLAWDETAAEPRPGVLVFHEGLGLGEFAMARARMLAELGHVALAADMNARECRRVRHTRNLAGGLNPLGLRVGVEWVRNRNPNHARRLRTGHFDRNDVDGLGRQRSREGHSRPARCAHHHQRR